MAIDTSKLCKTFNKWAETYDDSIAMADWGFDHYHDGIIWLCNQIHKSRCTKVIDLGCGTGVFAGMLQRIAPSIEYIGIDISNKMLNIAKRKSPNSTFVQTDFRHLDRWKTYLDNEYNCAVVSSYSFHHINDKEKIYLINNIFTKSKRHDLLFFIVDYAFINNSERSLLLEEQIKLGNYHIKKEIETEYYADLSSLKSALSKNLDISFERNGVWDWRITVQRYQ
ncbi:MAG: class I SAM-dependent methyltransferase [Thaumarchaeota archaeon]|nr:class I SAM-dependent methyltransferase [Nitrososphaerota archaeon]